jgi:hypothetical protein
VAASDLTAPAGMAPLERLARAGALLSNMAYNLSQQADRVGATNARDLDACRQEWDAARRAVPDLSCYLDALEALRLLFSAASVGDFVYTIRENELAGWDGPRVQAWGTGASVGERALKGRPALAGGARQVSASRARRVAVFVAALGATLLLRVAALAMDPEHEAHMRCGELVEASPVTAAELLHFWPGSSIPG